MKTKHTHNKRDYKHSGFTLVETAIAMGMVAVMISSFLVVFGPAIKGIDKSLSAKEADRLTNALELEMSVLRSEETDVDSDTLNLWATRLEKSFYWILRSTSDELNPVLVYQYRGNPQNVRDDGTLNPYAYNANDTGIPGQDYVIQTSVRRLNDALHNTKIQAELAPGVLQGKVYYVRMSQLRYDENGIMVDTTEPNNITEVYLNPDDEYTITETPDLYTDGVLAFRAQFYEVKASLWSYINSNAFSVNDGDDVGTEPDALGKPVLIRNMAVMR